MLLIDHHFTDTNYVLSNYKTEPCKRPPRLCRQGYACPQYHNSKDKRRSPRKFKYRYVWTMCMFIIFMYSARKGPNKIEKTKCIGF